MKGAIRTFTGKWINPLALYYKDIDPVDIAHSLSIINRYTGHTTEPYSVAQHSVMACDLASDKNKKWCLLHDASEYLLADLASPLKSTNYMNFYKALEDKLMIQVCKRFDLAWPMPQEVKEIDDLLLHTELRDLMGVSPNGHGTLPVVIEPWGWRTSKSHFINRLRRVGIEVGEGILV